MLDDQQAMDYNGNMNDLSVALPNDLRRYVEARVAQEGFADPAEYLRDLVRRDQNDYEADVKRVQALIQEGRDSGIVDAEPEAILDEIIADIALRYG